MRYTDNDILYGRVSLDTPYLEKKTPVLLTEETMALRKRKILDAMHKHYLDTVIIYADREHGHNFEYLTGFAPRFEEAILILHSNGEAYLLLGNEMLSMCKYCRIPAKPIHVPYFSLPNQPMENEQKMEDVLQSAGITMEKQVGLVGWKLFTGMLNKNEQLYDIPYYIVQAVKKVTKSVRNSCNIFISPKDGVRLENSANEIAYYEFGAAIASDCVKKCLDQVNVGKTEMELAAELNGYGHPVNVQKICAVGERFTHAIVEPRNKKVEIGERFSVTMGLKGGLTSRAGYVASSKDDLKEQEKDYLEIIARPYFAAAATWYSSIGIGVKAGDVFEEIETVLPKEKYGWTLNPGHFTASEEWMSSPFQKNSEVRLKSGMLLQMDIIPSVEGYGKASAEDGVALADEALRKQLEENYPVIWNRMQHRRKFMIEQLGIRLKEEVLPMSDLTGYYCPFLLNPQMAFKVKETSYEDY